MIPRPRAPSPGATHAEWLRLVEPSGPFLTVPVLLRALPNGLDRLPTPDRADLRSRLADALARPDDAATRTAWTEWVLGDLLSWGDQVRSGPAVPETLSHVVAEHQTVLRPTYALVEPTDGTVTDGGGRVRATAWLWPHGTALTSKVVGDSWSASPVDRAALAARACGVPIALVTNGLDWALVWAEVGRATGWASFPSHLFGEEPLLADAFVSICGARRFLGVAAGEQLEQLLVASASAQAEVTGQLGSQVRRAAELLVNALGNADREQSGALLAGIDGREVYGGAVAVLMRLVVAFSAEEKGLLPLGDELYDRTLAASTLLDELAARADRDGDEPLERSATAWHRLLALFRAVHGGLTHDRLRIPPYGGALFDPDRHPFLEGRPAGSGWHTVSAQPIPVDDLTVLAILRALQELEMKIKGGGRETRRLSYRSLDVEQIGHVYEGLLDHSAVRAGTHVLGLIGKEGLEPEEEIGQLVARAADRAGLLAWLKDRTKLSERRLEQALDAEPGPDDERRLAAACDNDAALLAAVRPWWGLLRLDLRGMPLVIAEGSLFVTQTGAKRDSGTAYTTRELADELVEHALAPLCYEPGPATEADPAKWQLKTAEQILGLRICDPAVGSGAILVAACRYLGARLIEAWSAEGTASQHDPELLEIEARRRVVERCLYGVDRDPMAVEMAKLSLWLVTMAKDRPFSFLDHALRQGDSLLGVTSLEQLRWFHLDPEQGRRLHGQGRLDVDLSVFDTAVEEAVELRRQLAEIPVNSVRDAELKADLAAKADARLADLSLVGDLLIGAALETNLRGHGNLESRLVSLEGSVAALLGSDEGTARSIRVDLIRKTVEWLNVGRPLGAPLRRPLHW